MVSRIPSFFRVSLCICIFLTSFLYQVSIHAADEKSPKIEEMDSLGPLDPQQAIDDQMEDTKALTWVLVKMLFFLLLVCVLAVVVLRFLMPRVSGYRGQTGELFEIISRFPLEARKTLYLVRVGQEYHLLGVGEHNINFLAKIEKHEVEEAMKNFKVQPGTFPKKTFLDLLQGYKPAGSGKAGENS